MWNKSKEKAVKWCTALILAFLAFPAAAVTTQLIDGFEGGMLGSWWTVRNGVVPDDVDVYNAISARYNGGAGPQLYYPPEGSWMVVVESGDPATTIETSFNAANGATLQFSWFFHTIVDSHEGYNDSAGIVLNGTSMVLITSATTGQGVGGENTGWQEFSLPLSPGQVSLGLWVKNDAAFPTYDSQFAIDNIRVTYAVPEASTWAMMLSGLGLIGYAVGRQRKAPVPIR